MHLAFLVVPYAVLTGAYAYVLLRGLVPVGVPWPAAAALAAALPTLHVAAFGLRVTRRGGRGFDALSWASYLLLGAFALVFALSVVRDVGWGIALVIDALTGVFPDDGTRDLWLGRINLVLFGLAAAGTVLGFVEATRRPRVRRVDVPIRGLAEALHGFTLGQLTDVHVGPTIKRPFVEGVVEALMAEAPDAIAITGDLVDGSVEELRDDVAPLARLSAPSGVYFVTGNHEYYAGAEAWVRHVASLGIRPLMNEHVVVEREGERLVLAGVTDASAGSILPAHRSDPAAAFRGAPEKSPRVLFAHQPRSALELDGLGVDLVMAGHTHGGQFWPWHLFVPLQQPVVAGLDEIGSSFVYTSRGTGYWGPPNRLGSRSEITVLRLVPA